jgi:hypothetical protein
VDHSLTRCQAELEALEKKLVVTSGWKAIGEALYWPLKEDDMKKTLENIRRLKATFSLVLSADQTWASQFDMRLTPLTLIGNWHLPYKIMSHVVDPIIFVIQARYEVINRTV